MGTPTSRTVTLNWVLPSAMVLAKVVINDDLGGTETTLLGSALSWTSGPLAMGSHNFTITGYDVAGTALVREVVLVEITSPLPPMASISGALN